MRASTCAVANAAIALWLPFTRPAGRVAELGSLAASVKLPAPQLLNLKPIAMGVIIALAAVAGALFG